MSAAVLLAAPATAQAAKPKLMPQSSESVAPAAKGQKTYQASMLGQCTGSNCYVTFGKKAKVRHITDISCLMVSSSGMALGALVKSDIRQISYLPIVTRGTSAGGEYATGIVAVDFDVPGGEVLSIEYSSSESATAMNCTVLGTIE
jgi:hypothetical protein